MLGASEGQWQERLRDTGPGGGGKGAKVQETTTNPEWLWENHQLSLSCLGGETEYMGICV